jgi:hypothetical protein
VHRTPTPLGLDDAFDEDNHRARSGHSAHNLAIIRHVALNFVKQDTSTKIGVKNRSLNVFDILIGALPSFW